MQRARMPADMQDHMERLFFDVWYQLAARGVVRPQWGAGKAWILTAFGREVVSNSWQAALASPDRYDLAIVEQAPAATAITRTYAAEALRAFHANLTISAAVTIGAAAERSVLDMEDAFIQFMPAEAQAMKSKRSIKQKFDYLVKRMDDQQVRLSLERALANKGLPVDDLRQHRIEFITTLTQTFTIYRITRNDAGHPIDPSIDRETLALLIRGFPRFARTVYGMVEQLRRAS
jgi:hypothetical protein